ncbi:MAG: hypothetical protein U0414_26295 [Polyangiaceae bacterium]
MLCVDQKRLIVLANHAVYALADGALSLLAGASEPGFADGVGRAAKLDQPTACAVDAKGTIYIADRNNHRVRALVGDTLTTIAGAEPGFADGALPDARFSSPVGIAIDEGGDVLVADYDNAKIRRIHENTVTTVGASVKLTGPRTLVRAADGAFYFTDGLLVRRLSGSTITTYAGGGAAGTASEGAVADLTLGDGASLAVGSDGRLVVVNGNDLLALAGGATRARTTSTRATRPSPRSGTRSSWAATPRRSIVRVQGQDVATVAGREARAVRGWLLGEARVQRPARDRRGAGGVLFVAGQRETSRIRAISAQGVSTVAGNVGTGPSRTVRSAKRR